MKIPVFPFIDAIDFTLRLVRRQPQPCVIEQRHRPWSRPAIVRRRNPPARQFKQENL